MPKRDYATELNQLTLPWKQVGQALELKTQVKDFGTALGKISQIGALAEELNHHPDINLHDYNQLTITTTTHSEGQWTDKDIELARRIDAILA